MACPHSENHSVLLTFGGKPLKPMHTFHPHSLVLILVTFCLTLLLPACSPTPAITHTPVPKQTFLPLGTTLYTYHGNASFYTVAWSPDGKRIVIGGAGGTVQGSGATTGRHLLNHYCPSNQVSGPALATPCERNSSAPPDKNPLVWGATTRRRTST